MALCDISVGQRATVTCIKAEGDLRQRLMDLGLCSNTKVECLCRAPGGDPSAYLIRGAVIALRNEDCKKILI